MEPDLRDYFSKSIPPGHYLVILSIAEFQPRNDARVAYAMLRLSERPVVKWEVAINDQHPREDEGEIHGYGVDSGTGCFMDLDAAQALHVLANPDPVAYESALRINRDQAWNLSSAALDRFEHEFCDRVIAEMDKNTFKKRFAASWASVLVNNVTKANVITF